MQLLTQADWDKEYSLLSTYLAVVAETEPPLLYHRWCLLSGLGAVLGRNIYLPFGYSKIYPNMYIMLIGSPGARKGTAIKMMKAMLKRAGYSSFAPDRISKQKLLMDMDGKESNKVNGNGNEKDIAGIALFGEEEDDTPREVYIAVDEFNDFIGQGNMDFITFLGNMWDYDDVYEDKIKTGVSVRVPFPTFNIVGGNTATGFATAFPPEMIGQGFLSRLLLIYGEKTERKITFPEDASSSQYEFLQGEISKIRKEVVGIVEIDTEARKFLDFIYQTTDDPVSDLRFRTYGTRRFTHLLKLCIIVAASRVSKTVNRNDVFLANTILSYTETLMPRALGEFGKSKHSDSATKIVELLGNSKEPMTVNELWVAVSNDFDKMSDFGSLLGRLREADKIVSVGKGIMLKHGKLGEAGKYFDYKLLKEARGKV